MPLSRNPQYDTHFYCALCGGPFAQVFRTTAIPAVEPHGRDEVDSDPENEFNLTDLHEDDNRVIPSEVVEADMSYASQRSRRIRLRTQKNGVMPEPRKVRQAYDGRRISTRQMRWTKSLRALIHKKAAKHPLHYDNFLEQDQMVYLTGKGTIRQCENWADAVPSFELEDDDLLPVSESARLANTYGFHVYKELGGDRVKSFISSIPFHEACWDLLDYAIQVSGEELGLKDMNDSISTDAIWNHLRSLITISGEKQEADLTRTILQADHRGQVVSRLGEIDYREAQSGGEGWHWKHEEGCHWLAADPWETVLHKPLKQLIATGLPPDLPQAPRAAKADPFMSLPTEIVLEIFRYLSSSDVFSTKLASPSALNVVLSDSFYRRFLEEEFKFLPTLRNGIERWRSGDYPHAIDWRGSFETLRRLMRTPRLSGHPDDEDYGKEWDGIDIGLKNKNRIWKIVKPIAETLVQTSPEALRAKHGASKHSSLRTGLVRGFVGIRSGREGSIRTVYFGPQSIADNDESDQELRMPSLVEIRVWCDAATGAFCGMRFHIQEHSNPRPVFKTFGREGGLHTDVNVRDKTLEALAFSLSGGIVCGVQIYSMPPEGARKFSRRIGIWEGCRDACMRKIVVPKEWRVFVGVTGFINSAGFIETIGLLECSTPQGRHDPSNFGPLPGPPPTVSLTHEEASVWKDRLPPFTVAMNEREGPDIPEWRTTGAEWEIWDPDERFYQEGVISIYEPRTKHRPRVLKKIVGHYDEKFLRGLEFVYDDKFDRSEVRSTIGRNNSTKRGEIEIAVAENIIAMVICSGDEGVHGILFVTDRRTVSDVFGPRYLGAHKVFAPQPDLNFKGRPKLAFHREEIQHKILGLHALYDYEDNRFLQLGIILPLEEGYTVFPQTMPCTIPFDVLEEQSGIWECGPPPPSWVIGSSSVFDETKSLYEPKRNSLYEFSGWAGLKGVTRVTVYGRLRGIKFKYISENGRPAKEIYFGYIDCEYDSLVQTIDIEGGEHIVGIGLIEETQSNTSHELTVADDGKDSIASTSSRAEAISLERIYFITNFNYDRLKFKLRQKFCCPNLVGVKFDFVYKQIISWAPIFASVEASRLSKAELYKRARYPWKKSAAFPFPGKKLVTFTEVPELEAPASVNLTTAISFSPNKDDRVDGIKTYVNRDGHFCGILLRRNGRWEKEAFGHRSGYEMSFDLGSDEYFDSLYLPQVGGKLSFEAVALCTNLGNTTPWIGKTTGTPTRITAPKESFPVGLYVAQKADGTHIFSWAYIGLLVRPRLSCDPPPSSRRPPPPSIPMHRVEDQLTGLPWLDAVGSPVSGAQDYPLPSRGRNYPPGPVKRATTCFNPSKLRQIRVRCGGTGVQALRFRGGDDMGTITFGEWAEEENLKLTRADKMNIDGPGGERIAEVKVAFHQQRLEEQWSVNILIGILIRTNWGRTKTITSPSLSPENSIDLKSENVMTAQIPKGAEMVGLRGLVGQYDVHDIGLLVKLKSSPSAGKG